MQVLQQPKAVAVCGRDEGGLMSQGDELRGLLAQATDPRQRALLVESARIADRLDELDRIIAGDGVLNLMRFRVKDLAEALEFADHPITVEVRFDAVLAEARQQASTLRGLLQSLGVERVTGAKPSGGGGGLLASVSAIGQGPAASAGVASSEVG